MSEEAGGGDVVLRGERGYGLVRLDALYGRVEMAHGLHATRCSAVRVAVPAGIQVCRSIQAPQGAPERLVELRVGESEAELERPRRHRALAETTSRPSRRRAAGSRSRGRARTAGRCSARPSARREVAVRDRLGRAAVERPGPVVRRARRGRAPTRSSTWIHGMYWRPPATGPPTPSGTAAASSRARRRPCRARSRCGSARRARRASPRRPPRAPTPRRRAARKSLAGRRLLVSRLVAASRP